MQNHRSHPLAFRLQQKPLLLRFGSIARLKVAESELSTQQEKNVLLAAEYSELVKNLEDRQREDSLQVIRYTGVLNRD